MNAMHGSDMCINIANIIISAKNIGYQLTQKT